MVALDNAAVAAFAAVGIVTSIGQQLGPLPTSSDSVDG
jgi:hypothetical protein